MNIWPGNSVFARLIITPLLEAEESRMIFHQTMIEQARTDFAKHVGWPQQLHWRGGL